MKQVDELPQQPKELRGRVIVMPQAYLPKKKKSFSLSKIMIFVALGVLLLLFIILLFFFFTSDAKNNGSGENVTTPQPVVQETVIPQAPAAEIEEPIVEQPISSIVLPVINDPNKRRGVDTDQDGLTDTEEALFFTNAATPDTDSDSFLDGTEVINLYDPAAAGALLEISPQIKIVRNDQFHYQFLAPQNWGVVKETPQGDSLTVTSVGGNETFSFKVIENPDRLSPAEWYQLQAEVVDFTRFNTFSNEAGWTGIQSRDELVVIATYGEDSQAGSRAFIFLLEYDTTASNLINYPSVWKMMLQSLAVFIPVQ